MVIWIVIVKFLLSSENQQLRHLSQLDPILIHNDYNHVLVHCKEVWIQRLKSNLVKLFKSIGVENLFNPGYINIVYQIVRSPIHLPPHFFRVFNHLRTLLTTSKLIFPTLYLHPEGYLRLNL